MAQVKVLMEGYTSGEADEHSCSTIVLVRYNKKSMVVDPGTMPDQKLLINSLKKEGLSVDDIDVVFITHSHMDHYRNIGMFPKAKALDYWGWWDGDVWSECTGKITEELSIVKTPGHNYDGITLLVKTDKGVIAICGDVFWKKDFPKDDPYANDKEKLKDSRKKVLELADWVIPGHGKMFKVEK